MTFETDYYFAAEDHTRVYDDMSKLLVANGMDTSRLRDDAENGESMRMIVKVVNVFSYGFIILISLIARGKRVQHHLHEYIPPAVSSQC
jgi:putative ABC transport system permease protein